MAPPDPEYPETLFAMNLELIIVVSPISFNKAPPYESLFPAALLFVNVEL